MDLLKIELEKKKKAIELAKKSSDVGRIGSNKSSEKSVSRTYFKAADVRRFQERQQEKEERERRQAISNKFTSRDKSSAKKRKSSGDLAKSNKRKGTLTNSGKRISDGDASKKTDENNIKQSLENKKDIIPDQDIDQSMTRQEVTNALRELGIPVWLFGERNDAQRLDRLKEAKETRKAAMVGLSEMDEYKLGSGHGIRNPFLGKNKDEDLELNKKHEKDMSKEKKVDNLQQLTMEKSDDPHKTIHSFFKSLLRQWEDDLSNRPDALKRTAAGKNETKTLKQCKDYIRPLFKLCKNRTLEENIMGSILKIVNFCKEGEFVRAHDCYMDVAIGRAAWPIGVTMVGIHQRSGRERINADKVAHVMNSELQRKYLTSVKRLMTYYQKKRPDVDPSKKVTNV